MLEKFINKIKSLFKKKEREEFSCQTINKNSSKSNNPYKLIWYRQGWSESKLNKNNQNYWKWESENNTESFLYEDKSEISVPTPTRTPNPNYKSKQYTPTMKKS